VHIADDGGVGRQKIAAPHRSRHIAAKSFQGGALRMLACHLWCALRLLCGRCAPTVQPPPANPSLFNALLARLPDLDSPFPHSPCLLPFSPPHSPCLSARPTCIAAEDKANDSPADGVGQQRRCGGRREGDGVKQGESYNLPFHHRVIGLRDYGPRLHVWRE
jgi:hypothetical protein